MWRVSARDDLVREWILLSRERGEEEEGEGADERGEGGRGAKEKCLGVFPSASRRLGQSEVRVGGEEQRALTSNPTISSPASLTYSGHPVTPPAHS